MEYLIKMKDVIVHEILNMWWFVLLSIIIAGLIKTYKFDMKLRDYLTGKRGSIGIIIATITGVISPLCSCGILPIVISLSAAGVPIPIVITLLVTSPIMGPDAFIITKGGLGTEFAILKLIAAIFMGLFAGFLTQFLVKKGVLSENSFHLKVKKKENGSMPTAYEIARDNDLTIPTMTVVPRANKFYFFLERCRDVGVFMIKMLAIAFFFEALMVTFVPVDVMNFLVGKDKFSLILLCAVIGFPLPVNQITVVPILAYLLNMGVSKSAALTLMVAGPISSFPTMITLYAMFDKKVLLNYLLISLVGPIIIGYTYMLIF